jgi:hypothetical protein
MTGSDFRELFSVFRKYRLTAIWTRNIVIWSRPTEGRVAIVTAAGRDAVDADAPITNGA